MPAPALLGGATKQIPVLLPNVYTVSNSGGITVPASGSFTFTTAGLGSGIVTDIASGTSFSLWFHDANGNPHCVSATCTGVSTTSGVTTITATVAKFWSTPTSSTSPQLYIASPAGPDVYPNGAFFAADATAAINAAFAQATAFASEGIRCEVVGGGDFCIATTLQPTCSYTIKWHGGWAYPCGTTITHPFYYAGQLWGTYGNGIAPHILPSVSCFLNGGPTIADVALGTNALTYTENVQLFMPAVEWCKYGRLLIAGGGGNFGPRITIGAINSCLYSGQEQSLTGSTDGVQGAYLKSYGVNYCTNYFQLLGLSMTTNGALTGTIAAGNTVDLPYGGTCPFATTGSYVVVQDGLGHGFLGKITGGIASSPLQVEVMQVSGLAVCPLDVLCNSNGGLFPTTSSSTSFPSGSTVSAYNNQMGANLIEDDEVNGNIAGTTGITINGGIFDNNHIFRSANSFGAFDAGTFIQAINGGMITSSKFEFGLYYINVQGTAGYGDFAGIRTNIPYFNNQNQLVNLSGPRAPLASYAASTSQGSGGASAFNGGVPLPYNIVPIAFTFASTLSAGSSQNFWVYSPFALGGASPRMQLTSMSSTGLAVAAVQDESALAGVDGNKYPGQFLVKITAVGAAIPSGSVAYFDMEFGR